MTKYLELGQIVNTFGIKGQVKVKPFTDDVYQFDEFKTIYVKKQNQEKKEYTIQEVKYHKEMILIKFLGVETPEEGDMLKNAYLLKERAELKPLKENQYYIVDLIGLEVVTDENIYLGKVKDILNTGGNDIYVVENVEGKELLLPGIPDVLKKTDLQARKITVHLIKGLID